MRRISSAVSWSVQDRTHWSFTSTPRTEPKDAVTENCPKSSEIVVAGISSPEVIASMIAVDASIGRAGPVA